MKKRKTEEEEPQITLTPVQRRVAEEIFDARMLHACTEVNPDVTRADVQRTIEELVSIDLFKVFMHLMNTAPIVIVDDQIENNVVPLIRNRKVNGTDS